METKEFEKKETSQTELGKVAEKLNNQGNEINKSVKNDTLLPDEELNKPIDEAIKMPEMSSLDCRSECRYNTGDGYKYSNYGFSG